MIPDCASASRHALVPVPLLDERLDPVQPFLPCDRHPPERNGVDRLHHCEAGGFEVGPQLFVGREVVAFRLLRQSPGTTDLDKQSEPPGRSQDAARLSQQLPLAPWRLGSPDGAEHAEAPPRVEDPRAERQSLRPRHQHRHAERLRRGCGRGTHRLSQD